MYKRQALNHVFENDTLSIYNEQLNTLGEFIFEKRKKFLIDFIPIFNNYHREITNSAESVQLVYQSDLFEKDTLTLLEEKIKQDK